MGQMESILRPHSHPTPSEAANSRRKSGHGCGFLSSEIINIGIHSRFNRHAACEDQRKKSSYSITDCMTEYLAEDEKFTTRKFRVPDTFQLSALLPSMAF